MGILALPPRSILAFPRPLVQAGFPLLEVPGQRLRLSIPGFLPLEALGGAARPCNMWMIA